MFERLAFQKHISFILKMMHGQEDVVPSWDTFREKIGLEQSSADDNTEKHSQLNKLYTDLLTTAITNSHQPGTNTNLNRLIIFNQLAHLVNENKKIENKVDFAIQLCPSQTGLTLNIDFRVANYSLLKTPGTEIEMQIMAKLKHHHHINHHGIIQPSLTTAVITGQHDAGLKEHQAALKIQAHVRKFQQRLHSKPANEFGIRTMSYTSNGIQQQFLFSENLVGHTLPPKNVVNGASGTFKKIIGRDSNNVLFEQKRKAANLAFSANQVEKILLENKIRSYKITSPITGSLYIAHNAGDHDLNTYVKTYPAAIPCQAFQPILADTKTLHIKGYFHGDIKPQNVQIKQKDKGEIQLCIIDTDSFSSRDKPCIFGTPRFLTQDLLRAKIENQTDPNLYANLAQTHDEFALALTILTAAGIKIPDNFIESKLPRRSKPIIIRNNNLQLTLDILEFIHKNIKEEFQNEFKQLIKNPSLYAQNKTHELYVYDMFYFN